MARLGRRQPNRAIVWRPRPLPDLTPVHAASTTLAYTGVVTSAAMPIPAGVVAGSTVVVRLGFEYTGTAPTGITPPASGGTWTAVGTPVSAVNGGSTIRQVVYEYRAVGSESGTWTFTWTNSSDCTGSAHRITGAAPSGSIFDAGVDYEAAGASSVNAPTTTVTTAGDTRLLLWFCLGFAGGATWTPPAGFTEVFEQINLTAAWAGQALQGSSGSVGGSNGTADLKVAFLGSVTPSGTADVTVNAGAATASFAAADASAEVDPAAGSPSVPVTAADAAASVGANAGAATVGFTAADAAAALDVAAGTAAVPFTAADAAAAVSVNADTATVPFTAADATVSTIPTTNADAGTAVVGFTAADAAVALTVDAGTVTLPATAADALGSVGPAAGTATVPLAAADAQVALDVQAGTATAPFTAADATVSTLAFTNADAGPATVTIAAADAQAGVAPAAGTASVPFVAADAVAVNSVTVDAAAAAVTVAAADAAIALGANAEAATVPLVAGVAGWGITAGSPALAVTAADALAGLGANADGALVVFTAADGLVVFEVPVFWAIGTATVQPEATGEVALAAESSQVALALAAQGEVSLR